MATRSRTNRSPRRVRYAVVGLGYIAQSAMIPAFAHARKNSELVALVSDDRTKLRTLGRRHGVRRLVDYEGFGELASSGEIDAVYIALPNHLHHAYTTGAAEAGLHVLCEKPMALTVRECEDMIDTCRQRNVKLMLSYRLHFEPANLRALAIAKSKRLGQLRAFHSVFANRVKAPDIRLEREDGGGTLFDIGIYCINAARALFRAEPTEVVATAVSPKGSRFSEVDEMTGATMHFPGDRLATFFTSFSTQDRAAYELLGTKGTLTLENAFGIADAKTLRVRGERGEKSQKFRPVDQFAPLLLHFSECILRNRAPQPGGDEGLADVRVIDALLRSVERREPVKLEERKTPPRPEPEKAERVPPIQEPELVHASSPEKE
jgi:glucose-fructose oxidoreductase